MSENKELPSLKELGKKIEEAKRNSHGQNPDGSLPVKGAMHISIELLAGVVAGMLVGYFLDKWLNTMPLFLIICFILGFAGAVRNIIRSSGNTE